ncbi:PQQ-binding-like beta-propeller repeat protein [soil metagenome]
MPGGLALMLSLAWIAPAAAQAPKPAAQQAPMYTANAAGGHPGQAIYQQQCAACHDNAEATRAPSKDTLRAMTFQTINYALTSGKMQVQGSKLDADMRGQLINYLTGAGIAALDDWSAKMACPGGRRTADLRGAATVSTYGFDADNSRKLTAQQAKLTKASLSKLDLAWAMPFPGSTMLRSQAAVVGSTLFLPVAEAGAVYAIDVKDAQKPCVVWSYVSATGAPLRTSAAYGVIADGRKLRAVAGLDSTVHLIDAVTGKPIWTKNVAAYSYSMTTGTPRILKGRIIVPVSQYEIMQAADNWVKCCTNHGFVLSLDPKTGAQQWRYDTMEDAKPIRDRGDGKMIYGPSGAPIWNSPVVDEKRGLIYFGTGESNSEPAHKNTDALIAVRLKDGTQAWSMQATADDTYNAGCGAEPKAELLNCTKKTVYRDVDFGASLILAHLKSGRDLLLAGQKSGTAWALDPATGKVVWRRDIGNGSAMGGIHWGIAYDRDTLFVPISTLGSRLPGGKPIDPKLSAGLYALDANTGETRWTYTPTADCENGRKARAPRCASSFGFSAAPTVIDGAVVQGSLDGMVWVVDETTGALLSRYDTLRDYAGVNGVKGRGGSIDGPGVTAANGLLLVNSGYGMFGQVAGNTLVALKPGG